MSNKPSISVADAKGTFSDLVTRVSHYKEHIVITRRGKEIAALIPIEDLQLLEDKQNQSDLQEALEALKEARAQGAIDWKQFKMELD